MFSHDISRVMAASCGNGGISEPVLRRAMQAGAEALHRQQEQLLPVFSNGMVSCDLNAIEELAAEIAARFSTVVVCGMGGSSLSGRMLCALAHNPFSGVSGRVRLHFLENIDPDSMDRLIHTADFANTLFLVISKSGGTAETMTHITILFEAARARQGGGVSGNFLAITETHDNPLRRYCDARSIRVLSHPADIGGRYAALTVVGLLPASIAGVDIRALCTGAARHLEACFAQGEQCPAVVGAAAAHTLAQQGKNISVLMPYCDALWPFALWHRQLWAESLGKDGKGTTPAPALGTVDQHSQLQLYLDGPKDKYFTLLVRDQRRRGSVISVAGEASLAYLEHHTIGDLMEAHQYGTLETLTRRQCPVRLITVPACDEATLGALIVHFMLETILTAALMGIDPLNQPAVEDAKKLAIERLRASGTR